MSDATGTLQLVSEISVLLASLLLIWVVAALDLSSRKLIRNDILTWANYQTGITVIGVIAAALMFTCFKSLLLLSESEPVAYSTALGSLTSLTWLVLVAAIIVTFIQTFPRIRDKDRGLSQQYRFNTGLERPYEVIILTWRFVLMLSFFFLSMLFVLNKIDHFPYVVVVSSSGFSTATIIGLMGFVPYLRERCILPLYRLIVSTQQFLQRTSTRVVRLLRDP